MTETVDATGYADALRTQLQRSLVQHGHGACRHDEQARYDFEAQLVICGCGHRVQLVGGQPAMPIPVADPGRGTELAPLGERPTAKDPVQATLAAIDPTQAYTPVDLEMRILDVLARLETGALFEREAIEREGRAKLEWRRAYWIAREASQAGAADRREAEAMVKTLELHQEYIETEMVAKAVKATMHNLRGILSGYQSVARSVGLDYQAGGSTR